jgi:UDP-4-amino-4,6-dideoxy-L-N-acetyl-beta-L-altrosamine transaminase
MNNFIPYGRQDINDDDINAVVDVLKSDFLTTGPKINEFEEAIAKYCGAKYCVAVSNGTTALHLVATLLLNKGDKVLTTPNSFLSTSNAILYVQAKPIFVDIGDDGNIDLDLCEEYLKNDNSIKAIFGVSFSGNPLNQDKLKYLKDTYNIKILEDNAHAIGSSFGNLKSGSCQNSDMSIFSFHPVKHLTTGEGGAITTNNEDDYKKLLSLRAHGVIKDSTMKPWEYQMTQLGFNYRITDFQCALGLSQLKRLDDFIAKRHNIAKRYDKAFENSIIKPLYKFTSNSSYHLYVVLVDFDSLEISKEELFIKLREFNIGIQLHYIPINKQPYYKSLGYGEENTPKMDRYYKECFSLPMYPLLEENEQNFVIQKLFELLK